MANYSIGTFLSPLTPQDRNIVIRDINGNVVYTIAPFTVTSIFVVANVLKIKTTSSNNIILLDFNNNNDPKTALNMFQSQLDVLRAKVPFIVEDDIRNYVTSIVASASGTSSVGATGPQGPIGPTGPQGPTGPLFNTSGLTGPSGSFGYLVFDSLHNISLIGSQSLVKTSLDVNTNLKLNGNVLTIGDYPNSFMGFSPGANDTIQYQISTNEDISGNGSVVTINTGTIDLAKYSSQSIASDISISNQSIDITSPSVNIDGTVSISDNLLVGTATTTSQNILAEIWAQPTGISIPLRVISDSNGRGLVISAQNNAVSNTGYAIQLNTNQGSTPINVIGSFQNANLGLPAPLLSLSSNFLIGSSYFTTDGSTLQVSGSGSFTGRVSGATAVNSNEFVVLGQLSGGSGATPSLQQVTSIGNTTSNSIYVIGNGSVTIGTSSNNGSALLVEGNVNIITSFTYSNGTLVPNTSIISYGDSVTAGQNATGNNGYIQRFAAFFTQSLTNYAISGSGVWYMANVALNGAAPPTKSSYITIMDGLNDYREAGSTPGVGLPSVKTDNKLIGAYYSVLMMHLNKQIITYNAPGVTWSTPPNAYSANLVGGYQTGGSLGTSSGTQSVMYSFTGSSIFVGLIGSSGDVEKHDTISFYIDNNLYSTIDTNQLTDDIIDGLSEDNRRGPYAYLIKGLLDGQHTLSCVSHALGTFVINYFALLDIPANCGPVILLQIPHLAPAGYTGSTNDAQLDHGSSLIQGIAATFSSMGYNVNYFPTMNYYNVSTGISGDNIHPSDIGHAQIAAGLESFASQIPVFNATNSVVVNNTGIILNSSSIGNSNISIRGLLVNNNAPYAIGVDTNNNLSLIQSSLFENNLQSVTDRGNTTTNNIIVASSSTPLVKLGSVSYNEAYFSAGANSIDGFSYYSMFYPNGSTDNKIFDFVNLGTTFAGRKINDSINQAGTWLLVNTNGVLIKSVEFPISTVLVSGTTPVYQINGSTNSVYIGTFQDTAQFSINRNPSTGGISDNTKYSTTIVLVGSSQSSQILFETGDGAGGPPTQKMLLTGPGNLIISNSGADNGAKLQVVGSASFTDRVSGATAINSNEFVVLGQISGGSGATPSLQQVTNVGYTTTNPAVINNYLSVSLSLTASSATTSVSITPTWSTTGITTALLVNPAIFSAGTGSALLDLQATNSSKFKVLSNGHVLINTTTDLGAAVQVNGNIISTDGSARNFLAPTFIGTSTADDLSIFAGGTTRLTVNATDGHLSLFTVGTSYQLTARNVALGFPVATIRPQNAGNLALDLMPNGSPGDYLNNGIVWMDVCDTDVASSGNVVSTARVAITTTSVQFGSVQFGGATAKPVVFIYATSGIGGGGQEAGRISTNGNWLFGATVSDGSLLQVAGSASFAAPISLSHFSGTASLSDGQIAYDGTHLYMNVGGVIKLIV